MGSPEAHRKLADCVEVLEEIEGIEVDESAVEKVKPKNGGMAALLGGQQQESRERLIITADLVEQVEVDEDSIFPEDPDDGVQIDFGDEEEEEAESEQ